MLLSRSVTSIDGVNDSSAGKMGQRQRSIHIRHSHTATRSRRLMKSLQNETLVQLKAFRPRLPVSYPCSCHIHVLSCRFRSSIRTIKKASVNARRVWVGISINQFRKILNQSLETISLVRSKEIDNSLVLCIRAGRFQNSLSFREDDARDTANA